MNLTEALHVSAGRRYIHPSGYVTADGRYNRSRIMTEIARVARLRAQRFGTSYRAEFAGAAATIWADARAVWRMANPEHPRTRAYFSETPSISTLGD